jgi:AraC-like DNA-binding protein
VIPPVTSPCAAAVGGSRLLRQGPDLTHDGDHHPHGVAGEVPRGAGQAPDGHFSAARGRASGSHVEFATRDPAQAYERLTAWYGVNMDLGGALAGDLHTMSRDDLGPVYLTRVRLAGRLDWAMSPLRRLVISNPLHGTQERDFAGVHDRLGPGDVAVLAAPDRPASGANHGLSNRAVVIDLQFLAELASNDPDRPASMTLDFHDCRPLSARDARQWCQVVDVADQIAARGRDDIPLVVGQAARFVAATALVLFPHTTPDDSVAPDVTDATPLTVRRAIDFIETAAEEDISVAQIAAAAHVTVRAVQLAFQHHLDTTPMRYLRRVRLERARDDLRAADPSCGHTVTDVAAHWGFLSPGRFSALYRNTFGELPSHTLRS